MKKWWFEFLIHILFWAGTSWLIIAGFSIQSHEIQVINGVETITLTRNIQIAYQLLIFIFISLLAFYSTYFIFNKLDEAGKNAWMGLIVVFVIFIMAVYGLSNFQFFPTAPPVPKQIVFGIYFFYFSLGVAYSLIKKGIHDQDYFQKVIIDKKQAELNLLRNQLQPHFLFNALNNLLAMVKPNESPKLVDAIERLSYLLRFVIEDSKEEKVLIKKEIEFIKNYLELQKLRFNEDELQIQFRVTGEFTGQKIEPGLFIPFVENAIKYGTEPEQASIINLEFDLTKPNTIRFTARNKNRMIHSKGLGTGIENTQKRLDLIYPGRYQLQIENSEDFIVHLTIRSQ